LFISEIELEMFLAYYYPAIRNALSVKEVGRVILESINDSVVFSRQVGNSNFYRYPIGEDAKCMQMQKGK
jgi:hypothetical protein